MKTSTLVIYWTARIVAALIMVQTLYFKFTAAPESIYIFSTIGMEPWGRIGVGVLELIASALLLINRTAFQGALLGLGLMAGAIGMHLTLLGISVQNDGGYLFFLALAVCVACAFVVALNWNKVRLILNGNFSELLKLS